MADDRGGEGVRHARQYGRYPVARDHARQPLQLARSTRVRRRAASRPWPPASSSPCSPRRPTPTCRRAGAARPSPSSSTRCTPSGCTWGPAAAVRADRGRGLPALDGPRREAAAGPLGRRAAVDRRTPPGRRRAPARPTARTPGRVAQVAAGDALTEADRLALDKTIRLAEQTCRFEFSVYVGPVEGDDTRAFGDPAPQPPRGRRPGACWCWSTRAAASSRSSPAARCAATSPTPRSSWPSWRWQSEFAAGDLAGRPAARHRHARRARAAADHPATPDAVEPADR